MTNKDYAIFSLDAIQWNAIDENGTHATATDSLECVETNVDYYQTANSQPAVIPDGREALIASLDGSGVITFEKPIAVQRQAVACKPAGSEGTLHSGGQTTWIVVSTSPDDPSRESPNILHENLFDFVTPTTSDIETAHLTEPLGCQGLKANLRKLKPQQTIPYHIERNQEELYIPLDGPGHVRVDGSTQQLQAGDVMRIGTDVPRAAVNLHDELRTWLMVGAPPTGDPHDWDPDAEYAEWPNR